MQKYNKYEYKTTFPKKNYYGHYFFVYQKFTSY